MQQTLKKIGLLALVLGGLFLMPVVRADSPTLNLNGQAWSSNVGWIDFHPVSVPGGVNYGGVTYNLTSGNLDGYAWSDNIGWISFKGSDTNNCPRSGGGPTCQPKIVQDPEFPNDPQKVMVTGWARVISACTDSKWNGNNCTSGGAGNKSGGWDGWISFNCVNDDSCECANDDDDCEENVNYKTTVDLAVTGDFFGWAWGSDKIGWISFNCANDNSCGTSEYKVKTTPITPPTVTIRSEDAQGNPKSNVSQGESVKLVWTSTDATTCTASGVWSGSKSAGGGSEDTQSLSFPPSSWTYTLTCDGQGGSAQASAVVSSLYNFSLNVEPDTTTASFVSGASASTSPVTVSFSPSGGFNSSVALSIVSITKDSDSSPLTGYACGSLSCSYQFSLATIGASQNSTLTITLPGSTQAGSYTATIQGVGGGLSNTANLKINGAGITPDIRER